MPILYLNINVILILILIYLVFQSKFMDILIFLKQNHNELYSESELLDSKLAKVLSSTYMPYFKHFCWL